MDLKYTLIRVNFLLLFLGISTIVQAQYSITDFGAKPNDKKADTKAIQYAIDECAKSGGGSIIFPAGTWLSGTVYLKSNISIYLSNGAIWQGVDDNDAYPFIEAKIMSREDEEPRRALVYGYNLENIKIHGEGTFYPGGDYDIFEATPEDKKYYERPFGIYLIKSKNITVSGIKMRNSAFWMQRYFYCDDVILQNLNIYNHVNKNNDGIDIDGCHNVLVDNCIIDSSDDALVLKSEGLRTCEDITISNCILSSHATPLKCGTGSLGGFKRITINNIVIRPSKSKQMIHPLKAWGGLSGIDLLCVDGGSMQDILISNVVMDSVQTPIFIKLGNRHDTWPGKPATTRGTIDNIKINNLTARQSGSISSAITGYPGNRVKNVQLTNVFLSVRGVDNLADTTAQVKENAGGYPFNRMFGSNLPAYGFYLRHAENVTFENVTFAIEKTEVRPAIYCEDVVNTELEDVEAETPEGDQPLLKIKSSDNMIIESSKSILKEKIKILDNSKVEIK